MQELAENYHHELHQQNLFSNDLYLTILFKGSGSKGNRITSRINQWVTGLSHGINKKQARATHQEALKILNETVLRFLASLAKYRVRRLGLHEGPHGVFSEQLRFFSTLLNADDISAYLPKHRLFFGAKGIEFHGNLDRHAYFAAMVSLKEYPASTYPGILSYLLELPVEMVITQSFAFQNRQDRFFHL